MTIRILTTALAVTLFSTPSATAATCEELSRLSLPHAKVDVQSVAAGAFAPAGGRGGGAPQAFATLPAFCRVMLSIAPTSTSDIKVEVWLPASGWNGRFQAIGQGGLAGSIPYGAMAPALASGYATAGAFDKWQVALSDIDGRPVEVLQGTKANELPVTLYFDASGLLVRMIRWNQTAVGPVPTQLDYSDYQDVSGVRMPFQWKMTWTGGENTIVLKEIRSNVPIEDARFARPVATQ